jgi:hypothetical protein
MLTSYMTHSIFTNARRVGRAVTVVLPAFLLAFGACSLDVTTPDVVPPEATAGAAALPTLLAGAVGDFAFAYSGYNNGNTGEGIVLNSGLFADEFIATDFFTSHIEIDSRALSVPNSSNTGVLRNLMRALTSAQTTSQRYVDAGQPNAAGRARVMNLAGMVYTIVAEDYCSGTPFSTIDADGTKHYGSGKTTSEMLTIAIAKFDSAIVIATAAGNSQQRNLAQIGKGRALIDAGRFAEASAAVAGVPVGFNFSTEQGTVDDRTKNGIFDLTYVDTRYTVADDEGGVGLPFVSADDPRVPTEFLGTSQFDGVTDLHPTPKYGDYTSPTPIATGTEAQLIRAEAALKGGSYAAAKGYLDALREDAGMDTLETAGTLTAQQDQLFSERAFWLFGTAHRMGDLRRLVSTQYGRSVPSVYPSGAYFKGGDYGAQVNFLVPKDEEQNPSFSRSACDPNKP